MKNINCDECTKHLCEVPKDTSLGAAGAIVEDKGFVYKNAALFSTEYSSLYFCSKECAKSFYEKHIPKNKKISDALAEIKSEIPEMARDVSNKMATLMDALKLNKL